MTTEAPDQSTGDGPASGGASKEAAAKEQLAVVLNERASIEHPGGGTTSWLEGGGFEIDDRGIFGGVEAKADGTFDGHLEYEYASTAYEETHDTAEAAVRWVEETAMSRLTDLLGGTGDPEVDW